MGPMRFERDIAAPVELVWATMTDVRRYPQRLTKVDSAVQVSSGPFDVGTTWRETRTVDGRASSVDFRIIACVPHRRYVAESDIGALSLLEYVFTPSKDGTRTVVRVTFSTSGGGIGHRLASWFFRARIAACVADHNNQDLADLARACESRPVRSAS